MSMLTFVNGFRPSVEWLGQRGGRCLRWKGWKVGREGGERRRSVTCQVVSGSGGRGRKDGDEKEVAVNISPKDHGTLPLRSFEDLRGNVDPKVFSNVMRYRFQRPTPVQGHCIPLLLAGKDVMACAQTGSGKTIMFLVPAISDMFKKFGSTLPSKKPTKQASPSILILAPTRELAQQIHSEAKKLTAGTDARNVCVFGGEPPRIQATHLSRGCDVMIATPGRLQMFMDRGLVSLRSVDFLVVDEADRMLDMGFEPQLQYIVKRLGPSTTRRNLMCSATFPEDIQYLAANFLDENYSFVTVGRVGSTTDLITQKLMWVEDADKPKALLKLLKDRAGVDKRTIIFINTKIEARAISKLLRENKIRMEEIHGDRTQAERQQALNRFKSGQTGILVATDVAARGLDVAGIDHVIQYDTAKDSDNYTHRIGRTGRAGSRGTATAFMNARQKFSAPSILRQLREVSQQVPTWLVGMAHIAQREHEVLVNSAAGTVGDESESDSGGEEEFGGQDFRKTAKKGTWGSQKDLNFADFDEKAYAGSATTTPSVEWDSSPEETSIVDAESHDSDVGRDSDKGTTTANGTASDQEPERGVDYERQQIKLAVERYKRPTPSRDLLQALDAARLQVGNRPEQRIEKMLQAKNRKLYFEYIGMFPVELIETYQSRFKGSTVGMKKILMVAEKPSVAEAVANILSRNRCRKRRGLGRNIPVFEFTTQFPATKEKVLVRVTSVVGHVLSLSFKESSMKENWRRNPALLFDCETIKQVEETSDKLRVVEHLQNEAAGCSFLALWLDCDREGENIAHEVISVTRESFEDDSRIYRAKFSALTTTEIDHAFQNLARPDPNQSMAVDARQELDLKVGVAFSRLLTNNFLRIVREKFSNDTKLLSYGPCQTPTLYFCVSRYNDIARFDRQKYWTVRARGIAGSEVILRWASEKTFDELEARRVETELYKFRDKARVVRVHTTERATKAPDALNTVKLLMACSKSMGISPKKTMTVAEKLYTSGFLSYPRTETSQYPPSMDIKAILHEHKNHSIWGKTASYILRKEPSTPKGGKQIGDHPPITPTRVATKEDVGGGLEWRVYEYVTRHFLGSLMGDMKFRELKSDVQIGGHHLIHKQIIVDEPGFAAAMSWNLQDVYRSDEDFRRPQQNENPRRAEAQMLFEGDQIALQKVQVQEKETEPPQLLQEHELVSLMDEHGVGTDASMAGHISTIVDRNYVVVCDKEGVPVPTGGMPKGKSRRSAGGRYMLPTPLGLSVIESFLRLDDQLVLPEIRAMMEKEVASIADGELDKNVVMDHNLKWFSQRFENFRGNISTMDQMLKEMLQPTKVHLKLTKNFFPSASASDPPSAGRPQSQKRKSHGAGAEKAPWRNTGPSSGNNRRGPTNGKQRRTRT